MRSIVVATAVMCASCATSAPSIAPPPEATTISTTISTPPTTDARFVPSAPVVDVENAKVATIAERFLVERPRLRREDCSGLVRDVLHDAGVERSGGARAMWMNAVAEGRVARDSIRAGDLVFFDRTWDSNGNGVVDDTLTHVAIVLRVERDGTVVMVHRSSSQIEELRMNLGAPHVHDARGVVVNSYLRSPRYGTRSAPRLTAELYHGHARPP